MASSRGKEAREQLKGDIAHKRFRPVYLFYGEEDFLADEAADALVAAALTDEERSFNLDVLYGAEADAHDIAARASSFPMMAERRVVVVRGVERLLGHELDVLAAYVERPSPSTVLILLGAPDLRRKPFNAVRQVGLAVEFPSLHDDEIPPWVEARIRKRGREIAPDAAKLLGAYVGTNLREIQNEIDKLFLYLGAKKQIGVDDVAAVVGISKEFTIFELQKSIGAKDIRRSTEIVERMIDAGEGAPFIIAMLFSYFSILWKVADLHHRGVSRSELSAQAKVNPYFIGEYVDALERFSAGEIRRAFGLLVTADEQVKTGTDPRQALHLLVVGLLAA